MGWQMKESERQQGKADSLIIDLSSLHPEHRNMPNDCRPMTELLFPSFSAFPPQKVHSHHQIHPVLIRLHTDSNSEYKKGCDVFSKKRGKVLSLLL
jgi:hypothetical protein